MVPGGMRFLWEVIDHQSLSKCFSNDDDKQGRGILPGKALRASKRCVLATCGIRRPALACENPSCCHFLLADSTEEEYNLKHSLIHLHRGGNGNSA